MNIAEIVAFATTFHLKPCFYQINPKELNLRVQNFKSIHKIKPFNATLGSFIPNKYNSVQS